MYYLLKKKKKRRKLFLFGWIFMFAHFSQYGYGYMGLYIVLYSYLKFKFDWVLFVTMQSTWNNERKNFSQLTFVRETQLLHKEKK